MIEQHNLFEMRLRLADFLLGFWFGGIIGAGLATAVVVW
jgi:hypothetical protein